MKYPLLIFLLAPLALSADTYLQEDFSKGMPSTFTVVDADGCDLQSAIYLHLGNSPEGWATGQVSGYGHAALSPTRNADPDTPADNWMILPTLHITDTDAVIRWESRSMHKHLPESYRVAVRKSGGDTWTDLYTCEAESYSFSIHALSLADYTDCDIDIAFVANTQHGFILAVDNVFVGVPDDHLYKFDNLTLHYAGDDSPVSIHGTLTYYGNESTWTHATLTIGDSTEAQDLPLLRCGESADIEFKVNAHSGDKLKYALTLTDDGTSTLIADDFVCVSHYPRTHLIDRASGTWCNNCPTMSLTTDRLLSFYGSQMQVVEAHVNDVLTNRAYWDNYLEGTVYAIPALIPNHEKDKLVYSLKANDYFEAKLSEETLCDISSSCVISDAGDVTVDTDVRFANPTDNTDDRYRVAIMLIGDIHSATNPYYLQSLLASVKDDEYYYMAEPVLPEMMYYDDVVVDGTVAYQGIPSSMPRNINAHETYHHRYSLPYPATDGLTNLRAVAMVIDKDTGAILNCTTTKATTDTAITDPHTDPYPTSPQYYDLQGRKITSPRSGIYIQNGKKIINPHP